METTNSRLVALRNSLIAARDCDQPGEQVIPQYMTGFRAGLNVAIQAVAFEIKLAELDERVEREINNIIKG